MVAYLWWPEEGFDWIHPDDVELATELIPKFAGFLPGGSRVSLFAAPLWQAINSRQTNDVVRSSNPRDTNWKTLVEVKSKMGKRQTVGCKNRGHFLESTRPEN